MDKNNLEYREAAIGRLLLALTDRLVEHQDADGLIVADSIMAELMACNVWASDLDLLALGEYAEFSSQDLRAGKSSARITAGDVRRRASESADTSAIA